MPESGGRVKRDLFGRIGRACLAVALACAPLLSGAGGLMAQGPAPLPPGERAEQHWKLSAHPTSGWRMQDTPHFRLHIPDGTPGGERLLQTIAGMAEASYARLSRQLEHRLSAAIPVFVFPSPQDFQAANLFARGPGESVGGFTDFARRRVVVPFTGDYQALRHVLTHEIVHAFQFSILPPELYARAPLWFMEGMAEFLSRGPGHRPDGDAEAYLRDLVLHDRVPGLRELLRRGPAAGYSNYAVGHAILRMLADARYGPGGTARVAFLLREYSATGDLERALRHSTGRSLAELDFDFTAELNWRYRAGFAAQLARRDARARVASFRYDRAARRADRSGLQLSPTLSPDGRQIAALTAVGPFPAIAIRPAPGPGVSRERAARATIVLRALRSEHFEVWQPDSNRLSWSPDGRYLLLAARSRGRAALLWVDVAAGEIAAELVPTFQPGEQRESAAGPFAHFARIMSPVIVSAVDTDSDAGARLRIAFVGLRGDRADLYSLSVEQGKLTHARRAGPGLLFGPRSIALPLNARQRLTDDDCFERDPAGGLDLEGWLYFSASCPNRRPAGADLFRVRLPGEHDAPAESAARVQQITALPGSARHPAPGLAGDLIFSSDWSGVRNLYRLPAGHLTQVPVRDPDRLTPLSNSATGVAHADVRVISGKQGAPGRNEQEHAVTDPVPRADRAVVRPGEYIAYSEREEGALEIKVLPPGVSATSTEADEPLRVQPAATRPTPQPDRPEAAAGPGDKSADQAGVGEWPASDGLANPQAYSPAFAFSSSPFLIIAGGRSRADSRRSSANSGSSREDDGDAVRIAALAGAELADDTGDHQIFVLGGYGEAPAQWTGDLRYSFLGWRTDLFVGGFRQSGGFPVPRIFDLDPNGLIYDPHFRVVDQTSYGIYGGAEYPLSKFSALRLRIEGGRDEIDFEDATGPDGRNQPDIATDFASAAVGYSYSNAIYGGFGPLDGQSLRLEYSVPLRPGSRGRETYALVGDYRLYHLFVNDWLPEDSVFALRAFAGGVGGADALDYRLRLGGYGNLRAYDFQSISGRYAFFTNIEYRFPLIRALLFALPVDWSPGWIRGVAFADVGGAFDDPALWQGYQSRTGRTRDLRLSYGAGLHFPNLLWFILPGSVLKVEWGTPYDLKTALPPRLWRGSFSIGVSF